MNKPLLICLFVLCCAFHSVWAADPPSRFPTNGEDFLKELKSFIEAAKQKDATLAFSEFEQQVRRGVYSEAELLSVISFSNSMLDLKLKACPYFCDYLKGVTRLKSASKNAHLFDNWHIVLDGMLKDVARKKFKPFKSMLTFSMAYFENGVLNETRSGLSWKTASQINRFELKDGSPCLVFDNTTLICEKKKESMTIENTEGCFFPVENKWRGIGGKVDWNKANLSEVYCQFENYEIKLDKGLYKVNKAHLHYPKYFDEKTVEGSLEDKILLGKKKGDSTYPVFKSNSNDYEIKTLGDGVYYRGGVKLKGSKLYGSGESKQKAFLQVYSNDGKYRLEAYAHQFVIRENERISGEEVAVSIYLNKDSLCHPSVNLKLELPNKQLSLYRGKRGSNRNPFYNSFAQMNIDSERLDWDMSTDEIIVNEKEIEIGNTNKKVTFESTAYFDNQDYRRLQSASSVHPLAVLKKVADEEKSDVVSAEKYAQTLNPRFDVSSINSLIYDLVAKGYITYDKDSKRIHVLGKVFHYCDASMNKTDYDILKIRSESDKTNARLLLAEKQIITNDVSILEFSDRQKVAARPLKGQIVLGENRAVSFDGKLFAGLGVLEGKNFAFDYDKFNLTADSLRYLDLFLATGKKDASGIPEAYSISSRIEHTAGTLLIDAPKNKSGQEDIKIFPALQTSRNAYVFYDLEEAFGACYKRDSFYFEIYPFTLNGLDEIRFDDFKFKGQMISGGIFPDFEETLLLQEDDHSLGFNHELPPEGYPAYNKGHFTGAINVSNKGLTGDGTIKYMWATIASKEMIFKPKQMLTSADKFELAKDGNSDIPLVSGNDITIDWRPQQDSMFVTAKEEAFKLYDNGTHTLHNMLILTPDGLKGRGVFDWESGKMEAGLFDLGTNTVSSDTTNLEIKVKGVNDLALHTTNVTSVFDFEKNIGHVKPNADTISTMLPYNEYKTSMNTFDWDINGESVTFLSGDKPYGSFLALGKNRDSLNFEGKTARFDLSTNELQVGGVPFIQVADAFIYPHEGSVNILPGGEIPMLENARLEANTKNKYHVFNRAKVVIDSRYHYQASGFYQYDIAGKQQEIKFTDIQGTFVKKGKKKKITETTATTAVEESQGFYMDPSLQFHGDISLKAAQENLLFEGFAKLSVPVLKNTDWFSINCVGDRKNLMIKYESPKNLRGEDVYTGLFIDRMSRRFYPSIMKSLHTEKDQHIFAVKGYMSHDEKNAEYQFGDSLKIASGVKQGDLLTLYETGEILAEGKFLFGPQHPLANATIVGQAKTHIDTPTAGEFNFMAGLNIYLPEKLMQIIHADFQANSFDMNPVMYKPYNFYEKALAELVPNTRSLSAMIAELKSQNELVFPAKENTFNFLFSKLPMTWNPQYMSFVSTNDKLGLGSINGTMFNNMVEAYVEFKLPPNSDAAMTLYIATPSGNFYYLSYQDGILNTVSNNEAYMETLVGMKSKELSKKVKGEGLYEINPVGNSTADMFKRKIKEGRK